MGILDKLRKGPQTGTGPSGQTNTARLIACLSNRVGPGGIPEQFQAIMRPMLKMVGDERVPDFVAWADDVCKSYMGLGPAQSPDPEAATRSNRDRLSVAVQLSKGSPIHPSVIAKASEMLPEDKIPAFIEGMAGLVDDYRKAG